MIFLRLIWSYLKIGIFGFGGGYAMLSLIENEVVDPGWISEKMFTDIVAISQMTPGPIGINSATYIGYVVPGVNDPAFNTPLWGVIGSLVCTLSVVIPPFILVAYMSHFIHKHKESPVIKSIFAGLRPVVVGMIASAALLLMNSDNFGETNNDIIISVLMCLSAFILVQFCKIHPILVIIIAGISGYFIYI